jgi:N6-adenosine-specific RNA methylase IME4
MEKNFNFKKQSMKPFLNFLWCKKKLCFKVMLKYHRITNKKLQNLPIHILQDDGFLFFWVVKSSYVDGLKMMENWGYKFVLIIFFINLFTVRRLRP